MKHSSDRSVQSLSKWLTNNMGGEGMNITHPGGLSYKWMLWAGAMTDFEFKKKCKIWVQEQVRLSYDNSDVVQFTLQFVVTSLTMEVEEAVTHAIHFYYTVASLPVWHTDYTCHHSHRPNESPAKDGVWNGLPRLAHSHAQSSATKTSVDLLSWAHWSQRVWLWTGHINWQAQQIYITSGLQLGRAEVLRGLTNFLNMDRPQHHCINHLKERGVEKGSSRHFTIQGQKRSVFNQTNIGMVLRATLGRLLRDRVDHVRAFPSTTMPSWALQCHLELKLKLKHWLGVKHQQLSKWNKKSCASGVTHLPWHTDWF